MFDFVQHQSVHHRIRSALRRDGILLSDSDLNMVSPRQQPVYGHHRDNECKQIQAQLNKKYSGRRIRRCSITHIVMANSGTSISNGSAYM
jgi:hypothetical protein